MIAAVIWLKRMKPNEFAARWGDDLKSVEFAGDPNFPPEVVKFYTAAGHPTFFAINDYRELYFDTRCEHLPTVWNRIVGGPTPGFLDQYWKIGDVFFEQAEAWICIDHNTGRIVDVDPQVDDDEMVRSINSSPLIFFRGMLLWKERFGNSRKPRKFDVNLHAAISDFAETKLFDDQDGRAFWFPNDFLCLDIADLKGYELIVSAS